MPRNLQAGDDPVAFPAEFLVFLHRLVAGAPLTLLPLPGDTGAAEHRPLASDGSVADPRRDGGAFLAPAHRVVLTGGAGSAEEDAGAGAMQAF